MRTTLVQLRNGVPTTTSLQIAQTFGKEHFNVLESIRSLECSPNFIALNFQAYHYHSKLNENVTRKLPMFYVTKDGFTFLVMGFTGKVAAKFKEDYINAFNSIEHKLKTEAVPKQAMQEAQQTLVAAQKQIEYWKSTANFWLNLNTKSTEIISLMSKNELRLAEMMVEYREKNTLLIKGREQVVSQIQRQLKRL